MAPDGRNRICQLTNNSMKKYQKILLIAFVLVSIGFGVARAQVVTNGVLDMQSQKIINVLSPTNASDAVNLQSLSTSTRWVKITKSYTDFSTASLTNTINIATVPLKTVVSAVVLNPSTSFTGGIISAYSISVGVASNIDLMPASSTFTTPTRPFTSNLIVAGKVGTADTITATAIAVTGLLNTATAGTVDIWLLESTVQ